MSRVTDETTSENKSIYFVKFLAKIEYMSDVWSIVSLNWSDYEFHFFDFKIMEFFQVTIALFLYLPFCHFLKQVFQVLFLQVKLS